MEGAFSVIWEQIRFAVIRTVVPIVVTLLLTAAAKTGISIDGSTLEAIVTNAVGVVLGVVYYIAARALEHFRDSRWGWLLGSPNAPHYYN